MLTWAYVLSLVFPTGVFLEISEGHKILLWVYDRVFVFTSFSYRVLKDITQLISMLEFNQGGVLSLKKGMISSICSKSRRPNCSRSVLVVMSHDWPTTCKGGHDLSFMRDVENLDGKDMKFEHSLYSINSPWMINERLPIHSLYLVSNVILNAKQ